ncbi:EthD domain-containing protein [Niallia taxi]|uniref:EthD domain-containing protein n=1 Tax=Niallia taxi TaxID=2499688 RepID=UPI002E1F60F6|nr:EthD domain-containing protein [Niallia taxi]
MHSIMYVFKRKPELTLEEFYYHYEHIHAPIAKRLPKLVEYRQHQTRLAGKGDGFYAGENRYDAASVYTFENAEDAEMAWLSSVGDELEEDTAKLIDTKTMITLPVTVRKVFTLE